MPQPTKRQFRAAIKDAIAYHRIPDHADYIGYRYGTGYTAQYGIYWPERGLVAAFRQRNDGSWYLGHSDDIAADSHMGRTLVAWSPP